MKNFLIDLQLFATNEEKTEQPTPHRLREARRKGQVARSSDLNAAVVILAMILFLFWTGGFLINNLTDYIHHVLAEEMAIVLSDGQLLTLYRLTINTFISLMAPVFLMAMTCGLLINFFQVGFMVTPEAFKPKASNINPVEGFKRLLSKKALVEFGKALGKISIVGIVVFLLVRRRFEELFLLSDMSVQAIAAFMGRMIFEVALGAALIFIIIALLDMIFQKYEFHRKMMMTKYEVKQEMKQTEGDPQLKSKLKEKQRAIATGRMMESVPEATVVVTNPVHLAVALKYEDDMEAPQVIAKGADYIAQKIKEKAAEYDIPVFEDETLARTLYENVEIGDAIPVELYQAVAEILAAIYRMKEK